MKKWIISDIDGTLARPDHLLSEKTVEVFLEAQKRGIGVVLASGRSPMSMQYYAKALQLERYTGLGFCFNGALIYDFKTHQTLRETVIPNSVLLESIRIGKEMGLELAVYHGDKVYTEVYNEKLTGGYMHQQRYKDVTDRTEETDRYAGIEYILVDDLGALTCDAHKLAAYIYDTNVWDDVILKAGNPLSFVRVNAYWIEMNPRADKGLALTQFCEHMDIDLAQVYVFGDGENDIPMFRAAQNKIAMGNAFASLKVLATDHALTNAQDGVATYICEHLF